jgi:putative endonuclease
LSAPHIRRGIEGEDLAAAWYVARGYTIVARNWRCRDGELDLILCRGRDLVVCEVKARASTRFGAPVEAVSRTKQLRIRRLAARWLREEARVRPENIRFDVASVLGGEVQVVQRAF